MKEIVSREEFNEKMLNIYSKFEAAEKDIEENGVVADPVITNELGGHLIIFRFKKEIAEKISDVSVLMSQTVPSIAYSPDSIHSTIISYREIPYMSEPDRFTLNLLESVAEQGVERLRQVPAPTIIYDQILANQTTTILRGEPDEHFWNYGHVMVNLCHQAGLTDVRFPWGPHTTINRNIDAAKAQELRRYRNLKETLQINFVATPDRIDVAWYTCDREKFAINVVGSFDL